jgi:hypothetical protein
MMQRSRYPYNWEQLAYQAKERAGWMCEECLVPHGAIVRSKRSGNPYVIYLHAAHVNHDHDNPSPVLKAVCSRCHQCHYRCKRVSISSVPLMCKRRRALRRKSDEEAKKLARNAWRPGASDDETVSKHQLSSSPSYSTRVQFGWQLQEGGQA